MSAVPAQVPQPGGPRYQPLVIVLAAAAAGIAADRFGPLPIAGWWGLTAAAWIAWLVLWRRAWWRTAAVALALSVAALAASWHHCGWHLFPDDDLGYFVRPAAQPACVEAIALKTPRPIPPPEPNPMRGVQPGDQVRLEVELTGIRDGARWRPVSGRARVSVQALLPDIRAGDRLQVFAQMAAPPSPRNAGEFDTAAHQRADRVRSQLRVEFAESVTRLAPGRPWRPLCLLEQVRMGGNRIFQQYLSRRNSALASAVLLGAREQLEPERTEAFVETGTVHLLVISGLHLSILTWTLLWALRRAPIARGWGLLAVALFTVLYMLVVDAEPPVVRATVLVLATCTAVGFGRRRLGFNSLAAAALAVLALNPADLFHVGAQLSFLCVAVLVWFAPFWSGAGREQDPLTRLIAENQSWLRRATEGVGRWLWRMAMVSLVIWLLTMPLVMARFHVVSPISVVVNPVVWLPMAVALVSGFLVLVCGTVLPPLAHVLGFCCNAVFGLLEWLVAVGQQVPRGHFWVPGPADWWLFGFYGGLGLLAAFPRWRPPRRWCVAMLAAWATVGFAAAGLRGDRQRLTCTFLSVGHGGAVVLELPSGQTLLYDAGQFGAPVSASRAISSFLWSRGRTHLDAVVLSHGDSDHYNALPGLLERFSVGAIYVSPVMFENDNEPMRALREAIGRSGVKLEETFAGHRLGHHPDWTIEVLNPPRRGVLGSDNANSLVLLVEYRGHRILLTGDLESPGLDDVVAERRTPCDVVLVPHHGSRQSDPERLAAWSTPRWAVISGTRRWDLRPVEAVYERHGAAVRHTADVGAVQATIDAAGVRVESFLER